MSRSVFPISTHPCFQSTLTFSKRLKALLTTRRGFVSSKTKPLDIQPVEHNGQLLVTDTHNLICKEPLLNPTVWELSTSDNVNVSTNRCHKAQIYYLPIMSYCSPPSGMNWFGTQFSRMAMMTMMMTMMMAMMTMMTWIGNKTTLAWAAAPMARVLAILSLAGTNIISTNVVAHPMTNVSKFTT